MNLKMDMLKWVNSKLVDDIIVEFFVSLKIVNIFLFFVVYII